MKRLTLLPKKTKKKIVNELADLLIVMDSADLRKYEMEYLVDAVVDICNLLEKDAAAELTMAVEERQSR